MSPSIVIAGIYSRSAEGRPPAPGDEYVVLINTGDMPVSLAGWSLTNLKPDRIHHYRYHFPRWLSDGCDWQLAPGSMAIVYTGRGCSCSVGEDQFHLYQQRDVQVWTEHGDLVCLQNPSGEVVSSFTVPGARQTA